jgi:hypothetical protein
MGQAGDDNYSSVVKLNLMSSALSAENKRSNATAAAQKREDGSTAV